MSVWQEVQEALYQRFVDQWGGATPYTFENETFDPPDGAWVRVSVKRLPGGQETLGGVGNRKMNRVGVVIIQLFVPPGDGIKVLSDYAEAAAAIYENERIATHDIRFAAVEPGDSGEVEDGRWWGLPVRGRFDYEELK